jgi:hypothetical protein
MTFSIAVLFKSSNAAEEVKVKERGFMKLGEEGEGSDREGSSDFLTQSHNSKQISQPVRQPPCPHCTQ